VAEVREAFERSTARGKTKPPRVTPRSAGEPRPEPTQALARIPTAMRGLAKTPAPFSVLVWLFMALGSGVLVVVEAVMLPLLYAAIGRWHAKHSDDERREAFEEEHERLRNAIAAHRRTMNWVATQTHPIKD
jgi:hypothetical protein